MSERNMNIADFDPEYMQRLGGNCAKKSTSSLSPQKTTVVHVLEAQGSQLTNKYAEGYPGKRYYVVVSTPMWLSN